MIVLQTHLVHTFIFKRVRAGEAWSDVIVAEYSGRPDTAEEYYENVRKLLTFYNARLLFENEEKESTLTLRINTAITSWLISQIKSI